MDALSDVLALIKPSSYMFRGLAASGDWAVRFPAHRGIMCFALSSGSAWVTVEGVEHALLQAGDCVLLPKEQAVRIGSAIDATPLDVCEVFPPVPEGGTATLNGGGEAFGLGGFFEFGGRHADVLLDVLPAIVQIRGEPERAALRSSIERIMQELREPQPGGFLMAQHLAHLMLLQALRTFMRDGGGRGVGWIYALGDRQISAALNAMHQDVARKWTLQTLAECAHMSRSTFALRFKERVGESPMDYLTRWRMLLASDRLLTSRDAISSIAPMLGYESDSAFTTAFRRVMGCSPRQYAQTHLSRDGLSAASPARPSHPP